MTRWIAMAVLLGVGIDFADSFEQQDYNAAEGKPVMNLTWDGPSAVKVRTDGWLVSASGDSSSTTLTFSVPRSGELGADKIDLFAIPHPPVRWHYALIGDVAYNNLPKKTALQMTACYLGGNCTVATDADAGANRLLDGTSPTRPFILPVQLLPDRGPLLELDVSLSFGGEENGTDCKLTLSNLKLVRYPDPPLAAASVSPPSSSKFGLDWKSFLIGTAATAILCLALAQTFILARRFRQLRADREMRQISSLDE